MTLSVRTQRISRSDQDYARSGALDRRKNFPVACDEVAIPYRRPFSQRLYVAALSRLRRWFGLGILLTYRRRLLAWRGIPDEIQNTYCFRKLDGPELRRFSADKQLRLTRRFLDDAAKRGDVCVGAFHGDDLVAYRWYAVAGIAPCFGGLDIRNTCPKQIYSYKMYTHRHFRGRRLQLYTMRFGDSIMLNRGYTHGILYVELHNLSSRKGLSRVKQQEYVGLIFGVRVLGRTFTFRTPGVCRFGLSLVRAAPETVTPAAAPKPSH